MPTPIKLKQGTNYYQPLCYFPIGYIYLSTSNTNPGQFFGGKWEPIKDRFLLLAGDNYSAGDIGGEEKHKHISPLTWYIPSGSNTAYVGTTNEYGSLKDHKRDVFAATVVQRGTPSSWKELLAYYTSESSNMPPYIVVYGWVKVSN